MAWSVWMSCGHKSAKKGPLSSSGSFSFWPDSIQLNWILGLLTETISTHKSLCAKKDWFYQTGCILSSCVTDTEMVEGQCSFKKPSHPQNTLKCNRWMRHKMCFLTSCALEKFQKKNPKWQYMCLVVIYSSFYLLIQQPEGLVYNKLMCFWVHPRSCVCSQSRETPANSTTSRFNFLLKPYVYI